MVNRHFYIETKDGQILKLREYIEKEDFKEWLKGREGFGKNIPVSNGWFIRGTVRKSFKFNEIIKTWEEEW